jgi:hypothetical protein
MAAPNTGAVVEVNGLSAGSTREKLHPYLLGITIDWKLTAQAKSACVGFQHMRSVTFEVIQVRPPH